VPQVSVVELISARSGVTETTFEVPSGTTDITGTQAVAFSPDGAVMATGGAEAKVDTWRTEDATPVESMELSTLFGYDPLEWWTTVSDLVFVDEHTLLVSSWEDNGGLAVWDSTGGPQVRVLRKPVVDLAPLAGTDLVAAATTPVGVFVESDAPVLICDLRARRISKPLFEDDPGIRIAGGHPAEAVSVSVSPEGLLLAAVIEDRLRVWNFVENEEVAVAGAEELVFNQVRFSPSGRLATVTSTHGNCINSVWATADAACTLSIWDPTTWTILAQVETPGLTALDFSPDGKELATGGWDPVIHIWEVP
jgi:WD40 repeat protein